MRHQTTILFTVIFLQPVKCSAQTGGSCIQIGCTASTTTPGPTTDSLTHQRTTCVTSLIGATCQKLDHWVSTSNQFQSLARRCQVQLGLLEVNKCKKIVALFFSPGFVLCPPVPATAVASLRIVLNVSSSDQGAGIQTKSAMILLKV